MVIRQLSVFATAIVLALAFSGCDKQPEPEAGSPTTATAKPSATVKAVATATAAAAATASAVASAAATATSTATAAAASAGGDADPKLLAPDKANEKAPETFKAKFVTSKGDFVIEVTRAWAPRGADRFYNLVKIGFFSDVFFFRVVKGFVVQFGIHGNPKVAAAWKAATLVDEAVKESNKRGYITYAKAGPDTRTTQYFINLNDNSKSLDGQGFSPFGKVTEGMEVVDKFYADYGDELTSQQGSIQNEGNAFLKREYPKLDFIKSATIVK
jgi:peptidyl-prolyl cis-trans isomerase A (cyclophilin A)